MAVARARNSWWVRRQERDVYVAARKREGWRSRAAFKLLEMQEKHGMIRRGGKVLDLGAAPGGWSEVAVGMVGEGGRVVALDKVAMEPLEGVRVVQGDLEDEDVVGRVREELGGWADVVLSDAAPSTTGNRMADRLRMEVLGERVVEVGLEVLRRGGWLVVKTRRGAQEEITARLRGSFVRVVGEKPASSRKESGEVYVVARELCV